MRSSLFVCVCVLYMWVHVHTCSHSCGVTGFTSKSPRLLSILLTGADSQLDSELIYISSQRSQLVPDHSMSLCLSASVPGPGITEYLHSLWVLIHGPHAWATSSSRTEPSGFPAWLSVLWLVHGAAGTHHLVPFSHLCQRAHPGSQFCALVSCALFTRP